MDSLISRLQTVMDECAVRLGREPQAELGRIAGASNSVVNQWLNGGIKSMALKFALNIEKELGYNHIWLMAGTGPKKVGSVTATHHDGAQAARHEPSRPEQALVYVDAYELRLLTAYREATDMGRAIIEETARVQPKRRIASIPEVAPSSNSGTTT